MVCLHFVSCLFTYLFFKGNNVYLYKRAMMELFKIRKGRCANFIKMDSILNEAGITKNEAFILHHGRLRKYISIPAIKVLMGKEFLVCKNPALKTDIGKSQFDQRDSYTKLLRRS